MKAHYYLFIAFAWKAHAISATHPPQEGFVDDDTYIASGTGKSPQGAKSQQAAEGLAKEAARLDAARKVASVSKREETSCGTASEGLTMREILSSHKALHAQCSLISDDPPAQECKVWIQIKKKGLKQLMATPADGRGDAAGCGPR